MKHLLTVQTLDIGDELAGEPPEWGDLRREWFEITPLTGREYNQAQQMQSNVTHKMRCTYWAGANSRMRLIKPNVEDRDNPLRTFNVQSVVNVGERNRELEWMCTEV